MRKLWIAVAIAASAGVAQAQEPQAACAGDTYGTAVTWFRDVDRASEEARSGNKLLMIVHLSGELDDPEKT